MSNRQMPVLKTRVRKKGQIKNAQDCAFFIYYLRRLLAFSANITFFASRRFLVLWECDTCRLSPEFLFAIGIFA
jgi:hypothetical protein